MQLVPLQLFVLVLQDDLNPRQYFGFVGWMNAVLLWDVNVCHHHLVIERKMYMGYCFLQIAPHLLLNIGVCVRDGSTCLQCNILC